MENENIAVLVLIVFVAIISVIALIITSIYASKKGTNDRMKKEGEFLDILAGSSSCKCQTQNVV